MVGPASRGAEADAERVKKLDIAGKARRTAWGRFRAYPCCGCHEPAGRGKAGHLRTFQPPMKKPGVVAGLVFSEERFPLEVESSTEMES